MYMTNTIRTNKGLSAKLENKIKYTEEESYKFYKSSKGKKENRKDWAGGRAFAF